MTTHPRLRGARILVVDDIQDAAESLRLLLESEGHEVRVALNGAEALIVAKAFKPDIAVLNLGMPMMDGYELARHLRTAQQDQSLHLVALTGWDDREHRMRATDAGFDTYQIKPINPDRFMGLIGTLVQ
jgi:DNA-binding response OmpR family regulator